MTTAALAYSCDAASRGAGRALVRVCEGEYVCVILPDPVATARRTAAPAGARARKTQERQCKSEKRTPCPTVLLVVVRKMLLNSTPLRPGPGGTALGQPGRERAWCGLSCWMLLGWRPCVRGSHREDCRVLPTSHSCSALEATLSATHVRVACDLCDRSRLGRWCRTSSRRP